MDNIVQNTTEKKSNLQEVSSDNPIPKKLHQNLPPYYTLPSGVCTIGIVPFLWSQETKLSTQPLILNPKKIGKMKQH